MEMFSALMVDVHVELMKNSVPTEQFAVYLMATRCNMMLGTVKCQGGLKLSGMCWTQMFDKLSDIKAWDCFNYNFLRWIIDRCLLESDAYKCLKSQIEQYDEKVEDFLRRTLLIEFLDVYRELFPDDSDYNEGCVKLKTKLAGDLPTMTLAQYRAKKGHLISQFRLQNCVLRLAVAGTGCVIFHWYLPQCYVSYIQDVCKELQPDFGQAGVIELCIDDCVLYQVS